MKIKELKQIKASEIETKLNDLKRELMKYNSQISTGTPPENPGKVRAIKKTIAQINTLLSKKQEQEVKTKSARN
ncbi:MAG: 50S ribosomal protein L29 [Nanoarchaeota archaeon]|jgi:large subunit ribosomal protein L29|nr:50S ribosomal protein L29 [Nanoarchaeota archaeon]|tara:strand:- start:28393 stop:28614 length:222 start_codon:yes stop_codon:yes gene_type:complete